MMNRREFCKTAWTPMAATIGNSPLKHARTLGEMLAGKALGLNDHATLAEFSLSNPVDHPFYWWPQTLLSWDFDARTLPATDELTLRCIETEKDIPFQLTAATADMEGGKPAGKVRFFSDLPAGQNRTYRLMKTKSPKRNVAPRPCMKTTTEDKLITLDAGPISVRIPNSQLISDVAPGPIMQIRRDREWVGRSLFSIPGMRVTRITTDCLESGPLLVIYRLRYEMDDGSQYIAEIESAVGMDFIRIREDMMGLSDLVDGAWEFLWDGCRFTNRQMPDHPYPFPRSEALDHRYDDYGWESMDATVINTHIGLVRGMDSNGLMEYCVGIYQPWPVWTVGSFISFWDKTGGNAAALFIDRAELWTDPDYPIWFSSRRLCIRFICGKDGLRWRWPIVRGGRSTGVAFYPHQKDIDQMVALEKYHLGDNLWHDGQRYQTDLFPTSYGQYLQNRYGTIDLDRVKDWVLTYGDDEQRPPVLFKENKVKTGRDLEDSWVHSSIGIQLPLSGTRQNSGYGPVPEREILDSLYPAFNSYFATLTVEQRRRCTALFLISAYMAVAEDYMPMLTMLSGHPNFLADVKAVPAAISALFPDHPKAYEWTEVFQKFLELNTQYHTRPAVRQWNAKAGRWTENLGTYVWGFLKPVVRTHYLLKQAGADNLIVTPQLAELGDWLVNALSAPFGGENQQFLDSPVVQKDMHYWGLVHPGDGPSRVHPPIGAHSERRRPPRMMWYLGTMLRQYAPITAEHLMWAARPTNQDEEARLDIPEPWNIAYEQNDNHGTNPHLRSSKYTGYGITLRAAVDTPKEISIHLHQIDDGPNYRWGFPGEGGCGVLYYFAGGKGYSHNAIEDQGDRDASDTDFVTNFGVWKDGYFKSIGQNVLSRPLFDLEIGQFAELVPRSGAESYCTPEYVSRSVLLVGADYFLLYDHVFNESIAHRLSWFVRKGDEFPFIIRLRGNHKSGTGAIFQPVQIDAGDTVGKWFDGSGDCLVCVTHNADVTPTATPYGAHVIEPHVEDWVFFNPTDVNFNKTGVVFQGTTGFVRRRTKGYEVCLIRGGLIGANSYVFRVSNSEIGISAHIEPGKSVLGRIVAHAPGAIDVMLPFEPTSERVFLNGALVEARQSGKFLHFDIAVGEYQWELTKSLPVPIAPVILRTENISGGAHLYGASVDAATTYRLELSEDNGNTWKAVMISSKPEFMVTGLINGKKYHGRLVAINEEKESMPGGDYPIYVSEHVPDSPAGLKVQLDTGLVTLTWGQVLGVKEYRLYRRRPGENEFILCYRGLDRLYSENDDLIRKADRFPGYTKNSDKSKVIEYYVAALNGNGESARSQIVNTSRSSWRNWTPKPGEPFRRSVVTNKYGKMPNDGLGPYYPH